MLCFSFHQSTENPPNPVDASFTALFKIGFLLWMAECPAHPTRIIEKEKLMTLSQEYYVVHPINQETATKRKRRISMIHMGSLYF